MSRFESATNEAQADQPSVTLVLLVDLDFPSGNVRVHDGLGPLTFGGHEYLGLGQMGGVEIDAEDSDIGAKGAKLTLSGIPGDFVPDILAETGYQGRDATIYIGFLDPDTSQWIDEPEVLWAGTMDYIDLSGAQNEASLVLYVEDELRRDPPMSYYTNEEQQVRFAGDKFFIDVPNVALYRAAWGASSTVYRNTNNPGSSAFRT